MNKFVFKIIHKLFSMKQFEHKIKIILPETDVRTLILIINMI